jgi:16S rRNA (guanine966-N2)-methyltransferase
MPRPPRRPAKPRPASAAAGGDPAEAISPPRIVGGHLRGRRLAHSPDGRTRPMKDRVRESLFDLIGTDVRGALALDLFAGTGALGFEAVSRGAAKAVFVERHFPTADIIRRSATELGVADRCEVKAGDVLLWPRRMPDLPRDLPWIAFVSPPWSFFAPDHPRHADLMALIDAVDRAAPPGSVIAVEGDTSLDPALLPAADGWDIRPVPPAVLYLRSHPPATPSAIFEGVAARSPAGETVPMPMDVVNQKDAPPFTTVDGSTIRELLAHRNSAIRQQSLAEARLGPGCATTPHHHAVTEEIYYILSGSADMTLGHETRPVGPGDAIAIPPGVRHTIRNTGAGELVFLCTCAPGYEHSDTFLEQPGPA